MHRRLALLLLLSVSLTALADPASKQEEQLSLSNLTTEEIKTYQYGEISTGALIGGGLLGTFVGFGTGHIVYGKYTSKGWIFTVSELASMLALVYGASQVTTCLLFIPGSDCAGGVAWYSVGAMGYVGFHLWEIIDVWTIPGSHNRDYRAIKSRLGIKELSRSIYLTPHFSSEVRNGTQIGLSLSLRL